MKRKRNNNEIHPKFLRNWLSIIESIIAGNQPLNGTDNPAKVGTKIWKESDVSEFNTALETVSGFNIYFIGVLLLKYSLLKKLVFTPIGLITDIFTPVFLNSRRKDSEKPNIGSNG